MVCLASIIVKCAASHSAQPVTLFWESDFSRTRDTPNYGWGADGHHRRHNRHLAHVELCPLAKMWSYWTSEKIAQNTGAPRTPNV